MDEQIIGSNNELTESSSDELKDLQKEYELKLQKILEKKKLKQERQKKMIESSATDVALVSSVATQIPISPEKATISIKEKLEVENRPTYSKKNVSNPFQATKKPASSNFVKKLYETGSSKDNIDYNNRIFEFENIPERKDLDSNEKEFFSGEILRKKYIKDDELKKILQNIKVLRVEKLLAKIAPPDYAEPMYENWCLIGFVIGKSEPRISKDRKKFIKLSVGNFNHSIDIILFADAFKKYWKLQLGELVVVLNPQLNVFKPPYRGFNLKLDEGFNAILEIGSVAFFGYCSAIKKDNKKCTNIINTKQNSLCAYHLDAHFKQSQNKRMELSGSVHLKSPTKNGKKQSMYLIKDGKSGYMDYNTINECTKIYGMQGAKLDSSRFHKPEILSSIDQKRRKLRDEKNNKLLENKLLKLANNSSIKNLGLIKKKPIQNSHSTKIFTSETLNKIGFNPISTNSTYQSPSKKRSKLSDDLKELYSLSQSTVKKLDSSIDTQNNKKVKWKENLRNLKEYQQKYAELQMTVNKPYITNKESKSSPPIPAYTMSDSCSDLEIAFDDQQDEKNYQKIMEGM